MNHLFYQYCPKLVMFDSNASKLLLCRRKGEADYDGVYSLIGGKMEHSDASIVRALQREMNEEVGNSFRAKLLPLFSIDVHFVKKDGSHMILPHFYAEHTTGEIELSDEYSDYAWVGVDELPQKKPIIENILWIAPRLQQVAKMAKDAEFVLI